MPIRICFSYISTRLRLLLTISSVGLLSALPLPMALTMANASVAVAQESLSNVLGIPPDATMYPIPGGVCKPNNGNLHVEMPIRVVKDRNNRPVTTSITYDNSFWPRKL